MAGQICGWPGACKIHILRSGSEFVAYLRYLDLQVHLIDLQVHLIELIVLSSLVSGDVFVSSTCPAKVRVRQWLPPAVKFAALRLALDSWCYISSPSIVLNPQGAAKLCCPVWQHSDSWFHPHIELTASMGVQHIHFRDKVFLKCIHDFIVCCAFIRCLCNNHCPSNCKRVLVPVFYGSLFTGSTLGCVYIIDEIAHACVSNAYW